MVSQFNKISFEEAYNLKYDTKFAKRAVFQSFNESVEFFLISIDKPDLENLVHIYYNDELGPLKRRYGWSLLTETITKLSVYSKILHSKDFIWTPTSKQQIWNSDFDKQYLTKFSNELKFMKQSLENYNKEIARESYWVIVGTSQNGPFMIVDGVHRAILTYIYYFVQNKEDFKPIEQVLCCISNNTKLPYFRNVAKLR